MNFLIIAQNLKVSGASEGVVSRSFLGKLRMAYPDAVIDVLYLKTNESEDQLHLLPVNSITTHIVKIKPTFFVKWTNRISWRIFNVSMYDRFVHKSFAKYIKQIDYNKYDHIIIRSAGLNHETILAAKDLPILKKSIINFHDPYPYFWYQNSKNEMKGVELSRLMDMYKVVYHAKACMSPAQLLSNDLGFLYGSQKKIYTLPHQYSDAVFDLNDTENVLKKNKKVTIAYHGSIQCDRPVETLLDAYKTLVETNQNIKENTEFVLRIGGGDVNMLRKKYADVSNISILKTLNFSNSAYEQKHITDINVILENGPLYCNILVGKAPFLASLNKPIFCVSPKRSELSQIINDEKYIASANNIEEIKQKLASLIHECIDLKEAANPFGDYFSDTNFTKTIDTILKS